MGNIKTTILLLMILIFGLSLRFIGSSDRYLWQDEAETTINSLQVLERGYPYNEFKGKPIYENASFIPSVSEKYEFASTNYYQTKYERNKGWLTFYWQALFLKIFGFSTFVARLPFIILYIPIIILIYFTGKRLFNLPIALTAGFLYSINYASIIYERQARYYALVTLLSLLCFYLFYLALTNNKSSTNFLPPCHSRESGNPEKIKINGNQKLAPDKWKYYLLSALGLVLLYYTHLVAALTIHIFFIISHAYYYRSFQAVFQKKLIISSLLALLSIAPWLILVKMWQVTGHYGDNGFKLVWLVFIAVGSLSYWLLRIMIAQKNFPNLKNLVIWSPVRYSLIFMATVIIVKPLLIVPESFGARQFLDLGPVFCLLMAYVLVSFFKNYKQRSAWLAFIGQVGIVFLFIFILSFFTEPIWHMWDTKWVKEAVLKLNKFDIATHIPIFVTYQQLPFQLYTDYNIELVWPIRKSYLDSYQGEMYFVINKKYFWPNIFYRQKVTDYQELNFYDKLKECQEKASFDETVIYYCPVKKPFPS